MVHQGRQWFVLVKTSTTVDYAASNIASNNASLEPSEPKDFENTNLIESRPSGRMPPFSFPPLHHQY